MLGGRGLAYPRIRNLDTRRKRSGREAVARGVQGFRIIHLVFSLSRNLAPS